MKKIFYTIIAALGLFSATSCQDMLSVDNNSMVVDPSLDQKTDSVFYALGIAQAMQQAADQYFFVGEMRGELTAPTTYANTNLKQLADYSATTANAYDSAYVYYKVINNCNYYLAHRDTTLFTGSTNVTIDEYAAVAAWRAWAYLQLCRTYCGDAKEGIPFFTQPITQISQIDEANFPKKNIKEIVAELAPQLEKFSARKVKVPTFGTNSYDIGTSNWGSNKKICPSRIFVPVDVILGELYLEEGQYMNAARKYAKYLAENGAVSEEIGSFRILGADYITTPEDYGAYNSILSNYDNNYSNVADPQDALTYIPMAVSKIQGQTTNVPLAFGYNYYSTNASAYCPVEDNPQLAPSKAFYALTDSCEYFYYPHNIGKGGIVESYPNEVKAWKCGDGRAEFGTSNSNANWILNRSKEDSTKVYIGKNIYANIILYRNSTIHLRFAEAINRAGYPDLAFVVLKNGISDYVKDLVMEPVLQKTESGDTLKTEEGEPVYAIPAYAYVRPESYKLLENELYFLNAENISKFPCEEVFGIHHHGGGFKNATKIENLVSVTGSKCTAVGSQCNLIYMPDVQVAKKLAELSQVMGVNGLITDLDLYIDAMEDILCDEYAKEFAFEGCRFYDLQRIARHKNESGIHGGNYGSRWFAKKLEGNNPVKSLLEPANWYLPFK